MAQGTKITNKQLFYNSKIAFESPGYKIENLAPGVNGTDAVNMNQLAGAISGVNQHAAARVATTVAGTFPGDFDAGSIVDGVTLVLGDRLLVKDQATAAENGIYIITTAGAVRAEDADGTPANEVMAGDLVAVVEGTVNAGRAYILLGTPDVPIVPGVGAQDWTLFSSSTLYTFAEGIQNNVGTIKLDYTGLTAAPVAVADLLSFYDDSTSLHKKITVTNFLADLDIVNGITANGFTTRTAADTYASRTFNASTVASRLGINIQNGDGVSGNPEIGLDIVGLTVLGAIDQANDYIPIFDASVSTNKRVTVSEIVGNSVTSITVDGNLVDSSTHAITITSGTGIASVVTGNDITFNLDLIANSGLEISGGQLRINLGATAIFGFLGVTDGGTGLTSATTGDLIYASAANTFNNLGIGATGEVLTVVGGLPVWAAALTGDITQVNITAGTGLSGTVNTTSGAHTQTIDVGAGDGILALADSVSINLGAGSTGNGLSKILGGGTNELGILIDPLSDTANLVSAIAISSDALKVGVDNSTIKMDGSGYLYVDSITASKVSDFTAASETAIFTAANFVDGITIDFTVTAGASVTAEVKANSITDSHIDTTNVGTIGQILSLGNSAGEFTYIDAPVIVSEGYIESVSENATDMNNDNGGGVITAVVGITDVFGATNPIATGRPRCFINGVFTPVSGANTGAVFFSNGTVAPFTAVALNSLAGTENLIVNTNGLGYNIAVTDNIVLEWKY